MSLLTCILYHPLEAWAVATLLICEKSDSLGCDLQRVRPVTFQVLPVFGLLTTWLGDLIQRIWVNLTAESEWVEKRLSFSRLILFIPINFRQNTWQRQSFKAFDPFGWNNKWLLPKSMGKVPLFLHRQALTYQTLNQFFFHTWYLIPATEPQTKTKRQVSVLTPNRHRTTQLHANLSFKIRF